MRWKHHQLVTAVTCYALNFPFEGILIGMAGSVFPDSIEFFFRTRHRGFFHCWAIYVFPLLFLYLVFSGLILHYGHYWWLFTCIHYFLIGCLFHIFQDSMSKSGVPFGLGYWGSKKRIKIGELYVTGEVSEVRIAMAIVVFLLGVKFFMVKTGLSSWQPEFLFNFKNFLIE